MRFLLVLVAAGVVAAGAGAARPVVKHTTAGNSAAKASLLTLADFGKGFKQGKPGTSGIELSCPGYQPASKGIVETGSASSPNFSGGTAGPFVVQMTSVFANAHQAATYWKRAVKPGLIRCVTATIQAVASKGIKVKVLSRGRLPLAKVGKMSAAYRVVATLSSPKQKLKTYFDVILVGHGHALSEITISSFLSPVPSKVEHALALIVEHNMSVPTA